MHSLKLVSLWYCFRTFNLAVAIQLELTVVISEFLGIIAVEYRTITFDII
nr:MAG: hypothetical protein H4RhizoLitter20952_000001 [Mitovirus sp.]QDH90425.1 MAG: hypothetical protein H3BulkLitter16893_000002 [Mitovirus sp.]QDH90782.1 MAG: hypothetical protein H3Bulk411325_000001 [Mitovirus sp.]